MVDLVLCTGNVSCTLETHSVLGKIDLQKDRLTMNFSIKPLNTTVEAKPSFWPSDAAQKGSLGLTSVWRMFIHCPNVMV